MENKFDEQNQDLPVFDVEEPQAKRTLKIRIKEAQKKKEEDAAINDVIFYEKLTPDIPEDETAPLKKGSVDMWFLLWAMLLICFGAVMSYSASAVFAEQRYDSSTYFFWRYIIFALLAIIVTAVFVALARPWMWRIFGVLGILSLVAGVLLILRKLKVF